MLRATETLPVPHTSSDGQQDLLLFIQPRHRAEDRNKTPWLSLIKLEWKETFKKSHFFME